ncbi:MAG: hypothetical protein M0D57_04005 [Sphingobacteriales bacterium JAD_PAG50586_3]|nr:MAG: hypothetical protein M0D57_04005 [Sphingobacteriales bacterium JAD_PAG50586_3]
MKNINFPLELTFKIGTLSNDFTAADAEGRTVAYVRSKLFKLKEDIQVFADESRTQLNYTIKANKWLDFSASYLFADSAGNNMGMVARKGWASLWKAEYEIFDSGNKLEFSIKEDNGWVKVGDALLGEVPLLGAFTGYFFNPSYSVVNTATGQPVAQLKKKKSFFGRRFNIIKLQPIDESQEARVLLGCMMMLLLERRRG